MPRDSPVTPPTHQQQQQQHQQQPSYSSNSSGASNAGSSQGESRPLKAPEQRMAQNGHRLGVTEGVVCFMVVLGVWEVVDDVVDLIVKHHHFSAFWVFGAVLLLAAGILICFAKSMGDHSLAAAVLLSVIGLWGLIKQAIHSIVLDEHAAVVVKGVLALIGLVCLHCITRRRPAAVPVVFKGHQSSSLLRGSGSVAV